MPQSHHILQIVITNSYPVPLTHKYSQSCLHVKKNYLNVNGTLDDQCKNIDDGLSEPFRENPADVGL